MASSSKQENQWEVYLRLKDVKQLELYDVNDNVLVCQVPNSSLFFKHANKQHDNIIRKYTYTKIFEATSSQEDVFNNVVKPKLDYFIKGQDCSFVTYGTSGAGKTFTLIGNSTKPGLIPRTLEDLFSRFPNLSKYPNAKSADNGECYALSDRESKKEREAFFNLLLKKFKHLEQYRNTYRKMEKSLNKGLNHQLTNDVDNTRSIWVSFAEILNEDIYDVLDCQNSSLKDRKKLAICDDYIKNLININVTTAFEAFQIFQFGAHNLNFLKTPISRYSNRSHCIFTIKLIQVYSKNYFKMSQIRFCDMVGPDYNKVKRDFGPDLIQSNNNSLLVFTKCIHDRQTQQLKQRNAYFDSTLTLLFRNAFVGNEDVALIVNINPISEIFDETMQILNVTTIAKTIIIEKEKVDVGIDTIDRSFEDQEERLKSIIDGLFEVLEETTTQNIDLHLNMQKELIQIIQHIDANIKNEQKQTMKVYNTEIKDLQKIVDNLKSFCVTSSGSQFIQCVNYDNLDTQQKERKSDSLVMLVSNILDKIRNASGLPEVKMIKENLVNLSGQNDQLKQSIICVIEEYYKKKQDSDAKIFRIMETCSENTIESEEPNRTGNI